MEQVTAMRVVDRLALVDRIGRELQSRFTFTDIDGFLAAFGVGKPDGSWGSKWAYSKDALRNVSEETVVRIAEKLDLTSPGSAGRIAAPPRNWRDNPQALRLFVSHISKDKDKATRLKDCLAPYGIFAFVAHEDINPTLEWQSEIERGLATMEAFLAILTPGFRNSVWTQQEIGFAVCRGVKVIALRMGEDPPGFLSKHQALSRGKRNADAIAEEIVRLLGEDIRTSSRLKEAAVSSRDEIPF